MYSEMIDALSREVGGGACRWSGALTAAFHIYKGSIDGLNNGRRRLSGITSHIVASHQSVAEMLKLKHDSKKLSSQSAAIT